MSSSANADTLLFFLYLQERLRVTHDERMANEIMEVLRRVRMRAAQEEKGESQEIGELSKVRCGHLSPLSVYWWFHQDAGGWLVHDVFFCGRTTGPPCHSRWIEKKSRETVLCLDDEARSSLGA